MSDQLTIVMSAEEARLWQSITSTVSKMAQMEKGFSKISNEARQAAKANQELERSAKRVFDETRTPQERHHAKLRELGTLLAQNKISQETFGRAVKQSQLHLDAAGSAAVKAFGAAALAQLSSYALGMVSIGAAVGTVTAGIKAMQKAAEDAASKQREAKFSLGSLAQVADKPGKGPDTYEKLKAAGEEMFRAGGAESLEEGYRQVFDIKSAGQMEDLPLFTRLKQSRMIQQPGVTAKAASTLQTSMGKEQTGGLKQMVSKGLAAAVIAPGTAEDVLQAAAQAAPSAAELKLSDEELLSATAIVAKATGDTQEAGTRIESLLKGLEKIASPTTMEQMRGIVPGRPDIRFGEMKGKNLQAMLKEVESKNLGAGDLQELFGRKEAVQAYRLLLRNKPEYEGLLGDIREADKGEELDWRLNIQDPERQAELGAAQAGARETLSRRKMGKTKHRVDERITNVQAGLREAGLDERIVQGTRGVMAVERNIQWATTGSEEGMLTPDAPRRLAGGAGLLFGATNPLMAIQRQLVDILTKSLAVQLGIQRAADGTNRKANVAGSGVVNTHTE